MWTFRPGGVGRGQAGRTRGKYRQGRSISFVAVPRVPGDASESDVSSHSESRRGGVGRGARLAGNRVSKPATARRSCWWRGGVFSPACSLFSLGLGARALAFLSTGICWPWTTMVLTRVHAYGKCRDACEESDFVISTTRLP